MNVRERPPLRLAYTIETPTGRRVRVGEDEPNPANVPAGVTFSDTMPGGFESLDARLPRRLGVNYTDLELATVRAEGAGGECAWEGRLERLPRASGAERSVTPGCVGWQAHLSDDSTAAEVYVDQDMTHWGQPSAQRRTELNTTSISPADHRVDSDLSTGAPALITEVVSPWAATALPISEAMYDAGVPVGSLYYAWKRGANLSAGPDTWDWRANLGTTDTFASQDTSGDLQAAGPSTGTLSATTATRRFASVYLHYSSGAVTADNFEYSTYWTSLAVYGAHGLTKRGTASASRAQGFYASDVIANAVGRWAPLLRFDTGPAGTIQATSFVIPQLEFREPTTAAAIIEAANRFHLDDWAVWEGPTFYYHPRGYRGRSWRARSGPAELEETGQSVERRWNGCVVTYQDVDGSARSVGPTGSSATATSASLLDTDPANPLNQRGIRKYVQLDMGIASTLEAATEVGRRFLEESQALDHSGQATLVGHVQDDRGVWHPYWKVRAGDTIIFTDAADTSERRIVSTSKDVDSRSCQIDLDAPPEGMTALLERLGVGLSEGG